MIGKLQSNSRLEHRPIKTTFSRELAVGLIAGLVGTVVMDLFGVAIILILGAAPSISFSIIGDAAAGFLSMIGLDVAGGVPLGAVLHYGIGLALGVVFVALVSRIDAFHLHSTLKSLGLGIVFVEIMSLPMLAGAAIILNMTPAETSQWFGMSFVMHLVYGGALGLIVRRGLRSPSGLR